MKTALCCCLQLALLLAFGCGQRPATAATAPYAGTYTQWAVACDQVLASEAGAEILAAGGNAVDAAVAASFCLSVVRPFSCGIGGGGFMIISLPGSAQHPNGQAVAIDYRETCPAGVGPSYFDDLPRAASRRGAKACAVPGTVAGLLYALDNYGTLDRATVLAPAIRAARNGFVADEAFVESLDALAATREALPELDLTAAWERFGGNGQRRVGDVIVNEPQAQALELIAAHGASAFYSGPIADAIVAAMAQGEGSLTHADLAAFRVREQPALDHSYGKWRVLSMPPPSSGGIATQQIFGLLSRWGGLRATAAHNSPAWLHTYLEASKHAFADRARWLADGVFTDVPVARLTSPDYLDSLALGFDPKHTLTNDAYGSAPQLPTDGGTSHISVLDADGLAVGCTETINLHWGSCVEVPGFGFMLNDEMDDFTTSEQANAFGLIQSDRNRPAPGKRPLSSMCPTIVLVDGETAAIVGASGGPRIISGTLQVLLSALVFGDDAPAAVARPRLHHQWQPDEVWVEKSWTDKATLDALKARGHNIVAYDKAVGVVQALVVHDGVITAASDPRKGGQPAGR